MMDEKKIDSFTKSLIKEAGLETPSTDFLKNVINRINEESVLKAEVVYKPLISKSGWLFIISLIILGLFGAFYGGSTTSIFSDLDVSYFSKLNFNVQFPELKFSKIFTLSVVVLAAMVTIQVFGIKYFYSKESLD